MQRFLNIRNTCVRTFPSTPQVPISRIFNSRPSSLNISHWSNIEKRKFHTSLWSSAETLSKNTSNSDFYIPPTSHQSSKINETSSVDEVVKWAVQFVEEEDALKLKVQKINGKSLLDLDALSLERCGILIGPASILSKEIVKLKGVVQGHRIKASSLKQLIETLVQNNDLKNMAKMVDNPFFFEYKERKEATNSLCKVTKLLFDSFCKDSSSRSDHVFPMLATGSGMGKTRFGYEAQHTVSDVLAEHGCQLNKRIFIDFNGGGDRIVDTWDKEPQFAMGVRLLARGIFGVSVKQLRVFLLPEEEYLCDPDVVLSEIAKKYCLSGSTLPTCILIHIDEFQIAHEQCVKAGKEAFVKQMLYTLGDYRTSVSASNQSSCAKKDNLFLIPLLTGTSRQGANFAMTQYCVFYLSMSPLSVNEAVDILKKEHGDSPILNTFEFKSMLCDIGVVPRYLEWLSKDISEHTDLWQNAPPHATSVFAEELKNPQKKDYKIASLISELGGETSQDTHQFLLWSISGHGVDWETKIHGTTIEKLAQLGNIFLTRKKDESYQLYFPTLLLNIFAKKINDQLLQNLTQFPLVNSWQKFEELALGIVVVRVNEIVMSGSISCSLLNLFIGAIGNTGLLNTKLNLFKLEMVKEKRKWIHSTRETKDIVETDDNIATKQTSDLIKFSECKYALLCQDGTNHVDARLCFKQDNGNKVLLVLQMRHSTNEKNYLDTTELQNIITVLEQHYPSYKIIVGAISNRPVSEQQMKDIKEGNNNIFIITKDELSLFASGLAHRLIHTFDLQFTTPN